MIWILREGHRLEELGLIPMFVSEADSRPAREQFDENYQHGGGWSPFKGHSFDPKTFELSYPDDPPLKPIAVATLRDETIIVYDYAFVLILQKDGSFEVCRMD